MRYSLVVNLDDITRLTVEVGSLDEHVVHRLAEALRTEFPVTVLCEVHTKEKVKL